MTTTTLEYFLTNLGDPLYYIMGSLILFVFIYFLWQFWLNYKKWYKNL